MSAPLRLGLAVLHLETRMDQLARVGLVDADQRLAILRGNEALVHGEMADGGREIAAIIAPVGDRLVDRFGEATVARTGGVIAATGMGTALTFPNIDNPYGLAAFMALLVAGGVFGWLVLSGRLQIMRGGET